MNHTAKLDASSRCSCSLAWGLQHYELGVCLLASLPLPIYRVVLEKPYKVEDAPEGGSTGLGGGFETCKIERWTMGNSRIGYGEESHSLRPYVYVHLLGP